MADVLLHADPPTQAMITTTDGGVPHLIVTCGNRRFEVTPGELVRVSGDVTLATIAGSTILVREANEWLRRLGDIVRCNNVMGEGLPET